MAEINTVIAEASQDLQTIEDFVNLPAGSDVRPRLLPSVNVGTLAGTRDAIFEAGGLPATPFATKTLMTASALADGDYAMVTDDSVAANNGLYIKTAGAWVKSAYDPTALANIYTDNKVKGVTNNFKTKALMTASALPNDSYAMVTDDTEANNGWYSKVAGAWVKVAYDPLVLAKADATTKANNAKNEAQLNIKAYIDSTNTITVAYGIEAFTVVGKFISLATGNEVVAATYTSTDFIPASEGVTYSYSISTSATSGGAWYDENKIMISTFGASSSGTYVDITSPPKTAFVRLSNVNSNPNAGLKAIGVFNEKKINAIINKAARSIRLDNAYGENDLNVENSYVSKTTGAFIPQPNYFRSDYLPVMPNEKYYVFITANSNPAGFVWYDKNKTYIGNITNTNNVEITSPPDAAYVVISSAGSLKSSVVFKRIKAGYNLKEVLNIVDSHNTSSEKNANGFEEYDIMKYDTVVKSKEELNTVNMGGVAERAYPVGRRVYDKSLRSEVIADGVFWRMPDGSAADTARRVYVYPEWDEIRKTLPTYAKAFKRVIDVNSHNLASWKNSDGVATDTVSVVESYGEKRLRITSSESGRYVFLDNNSALNLNTFLVLKVRFSEEETSSVRIGLFSASGELLFATQVVKPAYLGHVNDDKLMDIRLDLFTVVKTGAKMTDVANIGFQVTPVTGKTGQIFVSDVDTVSFKPKITLRFDDNRPSVYEYAYPIMQQYGFNGLIAVVTNHPELANDPEFPMIGNTIPKAGLLELSALGWDLVSHTHSHMNFEDKTDEYIREDYRRSRNYLLDELNAGSIAASCHVSPNGRRDERSAKIMREFFDCQVSGVFLNTQMPKQPVGVWKERDLWTSMGCHVGDNIDDPANLISAAQNAINEEGWSIVMMHDILPDVKNTSSTTTDAFAGFCAWLDANRDKIDVVTIGDVVRQIRPPA